MQKSQHRIGTGQEDFLDAMGDDLNLSGKGVSAAAAGASESKKPFVDKSRLFPMHSIEEHKSEEIDPM